MGHEGCCEVGGGEVWGHHFPAEGCVGIAGGLNVICFLVEKVRNHWLRTAVSCLLTFIDEFELAYLCRKEFSSFVVVCFVVVLVGVIVMLNIVGGNLL